MNFLVSMHRTIFFVDHSKPSKSVLNCRYVQTMSPCKSSKNNFSVYRKFTFNENNKSRTKLLVSPPIIHFALRTVPWIHFIFIALGKKSEIFFKTICKIILRQWHSSYAMNSIRSDPIQPDALKACINFKSTSPFQFQNQALHRTLFTSIQDMHLIRNKHNSSRKLALH